MSAFVPYLLWLLLWPVGVADPASAALEALADPSLGIEQGYVIRPGKEALVEGLTAPLASDDTIVPGAILGDTSIIKGVIAIAIEDVAGEVVGHLVLTHRGLMAEPVWTSTNYDIITTAPGPAADKLAERVVANDGESPWVAMVVESPASTVAPAPPPSPPLLQAVLLGSGLQKGVYLLTLVILAVLVVRQRRSLARELASTWPWLLAATLLAVGVRLVMTPTILKEANVFRGFYAMMEPAFGSHVAGDYPLAVEALVSLVRPPMAFLGGGELPESLFAVVAIMGILAVPAMYFAARSLGLSRTWAVVASVAVAASPHHARYSMSETYQIVAGTESLVLVGLVGLTMRWLGGDGRFGRSGWLVAGLTSLVALSLANVRPEWPLGVGLVVAGGVLTGRASLLRLVTSWRGWLVAGMLVAALVPSVLRVLVGTDDSSLYVGGVVELVGGLASPSRHTLLDPRLTLPLVPLLAVMGPFVLMGAKRWRLVGILVTTVAMTLVYLTLDSEILPLGEARYQVGLVPLWLLGATMGLAGLVERVGVRRGTSHAMAAALGVVIVFGAITMPALVTIEGDPQAEMAFLMAARGDVRALDGEGCVLVVPDNVDEVADLDPATGRDVVLWGGYWSSHEVVSVAEVLAEPQVVGEACHLYLEGLYCYRAGGQPPAGLHPQCQAVHDTFSLAPVVSTTVPHVPFHARLSKAVTVDTLTFGVYRLEIE